MLEGLFHVHSGPMSTQGTVEEFHQTSDPTLHIIEARLPVGSD
jgi:hypothetical protein